MWFRQTSTVFTPAQLEQRAELYDQLASLLSAGIPVIQSLEQIRAHPPARSYRKPLSQIIADLTAGQSLHYSLSRTGNWFPEFDLALLRAGEQSGRIVEGLRLLGRYYSERARLSRQMYSQLIYPILLFHLAAFIFPTQSLVALVWQGDVAGFLMDKSWLLAVYAGVGFVFFMTQRNSRGTLNAILQGMWRPIPMLGKALSDLALARLSAALEALISAGVPVFQAWEIAGSASGSSALERRIQTWKKPFENGATPDELIRRAPEFPETFSNLYHSGQISGKLDDHLRRLHVLYQESGYRKLNAFCQWLPKLVYFGVVTVVAFQIISFWTGYFQQISDLTR